MADSSLYSADHVERLTESGVEWLVEGTLVPSEERIARLLKRRSLFIVATNELDDEVLSAEEMLEGYKGQVQVERGFRFLKDPQFMASSFFLESERRIMALLMVMTLCLLVYSALERRIREGLQAQDLSFPDQKGNPTQRPTARWVFESFLGIHVLFEGQRRLVLNMKERHQIFLPSWVRDTIDFMRPTRDSQVSKVGDKPGPVRASH